MKTYTIFGTKNRKDLAVYNGNSKVKKFYYDVTDDDVTKFIYDLANDNVNDNPKELELKVGDGNDNGVYIDDNGVIKKVVYDGKVDVVDYENYDILVYGDV